MLHVSTFTAWIRACSPLGVEFDEATAVLQALVVEPCHELAEAS